MALTEITSKGIKDADIATADIADNAITLAKMAGGTDGQIITYDASGNPVAVGPGTDGQVLTSTGAGSPPAFEALPASNNYTHPNHSGEVTSTADGAQVIADDVVDEANLKVSNSPTNGYFLQAQSGNTGGLTWAESSGAQMGKIVCNTTTSAANSSSTTLADSNLSATMTPTAATSKIWVNIQQHCVVQEGTATYDGGNPDNRASIAISPYWTNDGGSNWNLLSSGGNDAGGAWSFGLDMRHEVGNGLSRNKGFVCHSFLIDHNDTADVTVKTQFKCGLANMNVTVQGGGRSSITLIEVLDP